MYAELYSDDSSSARAHLEHIELGSGASTNVRAGRELMERHRRDVWLTDEDGQPVAPECAGEDDEQEAHG